MGTRATDGRAGAAALSPTLMLINGAPGSGKSTLAALLAAQTPLALALDIDALKHALGGWDRDLHASGLQARRLAVAMIRQHLADGHDVVIGQYLARTPFLEELEQLAADCGATFVEAALVVDEETLAQRLAGRRAVPDRPEQAANDRFVGPEHAPDLVASIKTVLQQRPAAHRIDARGSRGQVLAQLRAMIGPSGQH